MTPLIAAAVGTVAVAVVAGGQGGADARWRRPSSLSFLTPLPRSGHPHPLSSALPPQDPAGVAAGLDGIDRRQWTPSVPSSGTTTQGTTTQCGTNPYVPLRVTPGSPCNVSITVCTDDGGATWRCNATAYRPADHTIDKAVGFGVKSSNQTLAFLDALTRLLLTMDATANSTDCSCVAVDRIPEGITCTLRVAYCAYLAPFDPSEPPDHTALLYRARAWDEDRPGVTGESAGYSNMGAGTSSAAAAQVEAANALRAAHPTRDCGQVAPLVLVPGFTSSTVQDRMVDSPPPKGHPLCPKHTANFDWEVLRRAEEPEPLRRAVLALNIRGRV